MEERLFSRLRNMPRIFFLRSSYERRAAACFVSEIMSTALLHVLELLHLLLRPLEPLLLEGLALGAGGRLLGGLARRRRRQQCREADPQKHHRPHCCPDLLSVHSPQFTVINPDFRISDLWHWGLGIGDKRLGPVLGVLFILARVQLYAY